MFGLKFTNHLRAHSVTRNMSWFNIPSISRIFEAEKKRELSSAKSLVKLNKFSDISFTYMRNKRGPSTDPCGTPAEVYFVVEVTEFKTTL